MAVLDWLQQLLGGGDPEAQGAAAASTAMMPAVNQWAQNVGSGEYLRQALPSTYDPGRSFAQNALDPRGLEAALNVALGVGPGAIKAYHGSPYDFTKFDPAKIGTGEGAQAYGHGLYFAENEATAKAYRDSLAGVTAHVTGPQGYVGPQGAVTATQIAKALPIVEGAQPWLRSSVAQAWMDNPGRLDPEAVMRNAYGAEYPTIFARATPDVEAKVWADIRRMIDAAQPELDKYSVKHPGHMYEVNINADPERFLDWDKLLLDQPQSVQDAFAKRVAEIQQSGQPTLSGVMTDIRRGMLPGSSVYQTMGRGTPESASAALNQAGIPGIRYLDQGSRGAGQGTSNYVVFDPSIIEILRKYGILGPVAGAGLLGAADQQ